MTGYTQKHGKGWRYRIEFDPNPNGKRKTISKSGFKKESEAKKALIKKLNEINDGKYIEDNGLTVEEYLKEWLESYKNNIALSTYKRYEEFCNSISKGLEEQELQKLTPVAIQKFYSSLSPGLSNSTILRLHSCFNLALKQAVAWNMLSSNPCQFVKPPRPEKKEMKVWDEETVQDFLAESRGENIYIAIALALGTGMREGEICALMWDDVNLKKGEIYVRRSVKKIDGKYIFKEPKTKASSRRILIANDLKDILTFHKKKQDRLKEENEQYKNKDYVCAWDDDGRMFDPAYISAVFPRIVRKYNEKYKYDKYPIIRFHDLRHTHATLLLLHDVPAKVVSERLGHSNISITLDTYSHVLPSMQQDAAEKLNGLFTKAL